ncbi:MAG: ribonuclease III [Sideroxydans sp.]|nr:ribonuclease III [Sideroxydans sp.]NOT98379.1 ribonuclease III [Sideroxydans sp.]
MKRAALCRQINYQFAQPVLLQRALTHRSYSAGHNERLEFLGDSVLNCVVAKYLFQTFPEVNEGDLSRLRSNLVNQQTLALIAHQLNLGECLALGEGELKSAGASRPSILADALEAIFGAVLLDADFAAAEKVVLGLYVPFIAKTDLATLGKDAKTLLQEYLQGRKMALPQYTVMHIKGEAHAQTFVVSCVISKLNITSQGEGATRRLAEQVAAEAAYKRIKP